MPPQPLNKCQFGLFCEHKQQKSHLLLKELRKLATIAPIRSLLPSIDKPLALPLRDGTPPAPGDMLSLTWEEANAIESILLAVDDAITRMSQAWFFAGDLYSGEV